MLLNKTGQLRELCHIIIVQGLIHLVLQIPADSHLMSEIGKDGLAIAVGVLQEEEDPASQIMDTQETSAGIVGRLISERKDMSDRLR